MQDREFFVNSRERGGTLANLSLILAMVSCLSSGYLFTQYSQLKNQKAESMASQELLMDQVSSLETDLQASLKMQQQYKESAAESKKEKLDIAMQLAEMKAHSEKQAGLLEEIKGELEAFKKIAGSVTSSAVMDPSAANGLSVIEPLPVQESQMQLPAPGQEFGAMKVKTINRSFNFVVFDLVPGQTLRVGDPIAAKRNGQWVADLKVKQVYAKFASAEIRKESDDQLLQIGDQLSPA